MMHKFFFVGACLMWIIFIVSIVGYVDVFDKIKGYQHLSSLAGIGLNLMWFAFFCYLYYQNRPKKADFNEINQMIEEFNVKQDIKE